MSLKKLAFPGDHWGSNNQRPLHGLFGILTPRTGWMLIRKRELQNFWKWTLSPTRISCSELHDGFSTVVGLIQLGFYMLSSTRARNNNEHHAMKPWSHGCLGILWRLSFGEPWIVSTPWGWPPANALSRNTEECRNGDFLVVSSMYLTRCICHSCREKEGLDEAFLDYMAYTGNPNDLSSKTGQ